MIVFMNATIHPPLEALAAAPTIERIETMLVDLPTIRPHKLSVATMTGQTLMMVRIYASDGID